MVVWWGNWSSWIMLDVHGRPSPCMSAIVSEARRQDREILTADHPSVASQDGIQGLPLHSVRINGYLPQLAGGVDGNA